MKLAFLGLGVMGYPMAGHLAAKGGHEVTVYNRTAARAEKWIAQFGARYVAQSGGKRAASPEQAAHGADMVFCCVGDDPDVREVTLGTQGAFQAMSPGAIFVDHTTDSARLARELAQRASDAGFHFLDAPVSGGQAGAENGALTIMAGGESGAFERAKPLMDRYAKAVTLMGPAGSGQLTKMVNQILIAGLLEGLAEGLAFAQRAGLDANKAIDVISKGAAQSWQLDNRGRTMVEDRFDFGFAVDWMRKDLRICLEEAGGNGAALPVAELVSGFYDEVSAMGGGRWDTSSLIRRLRR
jgi:3-hydroxyisobutyrate dehydrogenase